MSARDNGQRGATRGPSGKRGRSASRALPFAVRNSRIAGKGAFATRRIRKGQRIIEYVGERISDAEADRRYNDYEMNVHHTFLFTVDKDTVIDAAVGGNAARFINHSCAPNCEAIDDDGRIFIEAIRNIQPGVELTYDYQYERSRGDGAEEEGLYPCRCGAGRCRGTILAPPPRRRKRRKHDARSKRNAR